MITFKDIELTKVELSDAAKFIQRVKDTEGSYGFIDDINTDAAKKVTMLIGKFFNLPKKAVVHTWTTKSRYGGNSNMELQISKAGIGATNGYRSQIEVYYRLLQSNDYYDMKGLIADVIDDKNIYDKTLANLSEKGKSVLNSLKEAREESNIQMPKANSIEIPLNLSAEELSAFNLTDNNVKILIEDDSREVSVYLRLPKADQYANEKNVFKLNGLDINDEKDFQYFLFVHYHLPEFKLALENYIIATKDHKERWAKFKELINDKLAKYLLLIKI